MASYKLVELHIVHKRGDTSSINIELVDVNGVDVPASTFTSAKCEVRKSRAQDPIYTFDTSDSSMILTDGNIELVFDANDNKPADYYADIEFVLSSDSKKITPVNITWEEVDDDTI